MSYTLRGRIDSRVAGALAPLAAACVWAALAGRAWPVELAASMVGVGALLDVLVWDRIDYQRAWVALPLGGVELVAVMGATRALGITPPFRQAVAFFCAAWLLAQIFGHTVLPRARLTYASDGGELGRAAPVVALAALALVAGAAGTARAVAPPALLLEGVHGPLVVDTPETIVGGRGAIVRGGIVVRANDVTLRDLTVVGGENGIDVENAHDVRLERVRVRGARLDGIHVRGASVVIRDCNVSVPRGAAGQGIDISFAMSSGMSVVRGCRVRGGEQGIAVHTSSVELDDNDVRATARQAIAVTEMSMGMVERNRVDGALGVGIYCGDQSVCMIERNVVGRVRADVASGDATRAGYAIEAHSNSSAELRANRARRVGAFLGAEIVR